MFDRLVTIDLLVDPVEADHSRELLTRSGIDAVLQVREGDAAAICLQELRVPESQANRAIEILEPRRGMRPHPARSEAHRAARIALVGIAIPPLQLYSMWIVARMARRRSQLSAADRRYLVLAALLDLWLPVVILGSYALATQ
jgi:hypothetical protein